MYAAIAPSVSVVSVGVPHWDRAGPAAGTRAYPPGIWNRMPADACHRVAFAPNGLVTG